MTIIKCKMCGGDLKLIAGQTVAECEYCGISQTVPQMDDEKKLIQFERAERLRKQCEFDKAAGIYENIVADFRQEAEAYWGLVLCKFGIEYVDDPATGKKIPTCHRSSFDSVMEDSDFEQALENADVLARKVYREEAKAIEEIRRGIIAVSANEQPYDIFICYKETDHLGQRTLDSVLAQDIYDALTDKGYRVFFSRITLEDKLGVEYEPYIFAALNSAKIMLAIGTDYEYYNAVWVKNEWSRFLKLMAKDKEKHLIPCFKGIDAYDMPKAFAKLQAQDLGKVGATQDLLRGIEKLLKSAVSIEPVQAVLQRSPAANFVMRGNLALEDQNWEAAARFFEEALNQDAEYADAYLGLAQCEAKADSLERLVAGQHWQNKNYQLAKRFATEQMRQQLQELEAAVDRNKEKLLYEDAIKLMQNAKSSSAYSRAAELFDSLNGYENAKEYAAVCRENACKDRTYESAKHRMANRTNYVDNLRRAISLLDQIPGWRDADAIKAQCLEIMEQEKSAMAYTKRYKSAKRDRILSEIKQLEEERAALPILFNMARRIEINERLKQLDYELKGL